MAARNAVLSQSSEFKEARVRALTNAVAVYDLLTVVLVRWRQFTLLQEVCNINDYSGQRNCCVQLHTPVNNRLYLSKFKSRIKLGSILQPVKLIKFVKMAIVQQFSIYNIAFDFFNSPSTEQ